MSNKPYPLYGNVNKMQKLHKKNNGRLPKGLKPTSVTHLNEVGKKSMEEHVSNWWARRCDEVKIFDKTYNQVVEGWDYYGKLPWPDTVSISAVYMDFQVSTEKRLSRQRFIRLWREVSGLTITVNKPFKVLTDEGSLLYTRSMTHYVLSGYLDNDWRYHYNRVKDQREEKS